MGSVACVRCGSPEDERSASYGVAGFLCARCYAREPALVELFGVTLPADVAIAMQRHGAPCPWQPVPSGEAATRHGAVATLDALGVHGVHWLTERADAEHRGTPHDATTAEGHRQLWWLLRPVNLAVCFVRKGLVDQVSTLLHRGFQSGDEAFDRTVSVHASISEALVVWLRDANVRDAITEIIRHDGYLMIHPDVVHTAPDGSGPLHRGAAVHGYVFRGPRRDVGGASAVCASS